MQNFTNAVGAILDAFSTLLDASFNNTLDSPVVQHLNSTFDKIGISLDDVIADLNFIENDPSTANNTVNTTVVELFQVLFDVMAVVIKVTNFVVCYNLFLIDV